MEVMLLRMDESYWPLYPYQKYFSGKMDHDEENTKNHHYLSQNLEYKSKVSIVISFYTAKHCSKAPDRKGY